MAEAVMTRRTLSPALPEQALKGAATFWFLVAAIGHWIFVAYIVGHYGPLIFQGGLAGLADSEMPNGYVAGDWLGNAAAAAHVLLAVIVIGGGPLQLIPQIRARFPLFHRGLGRCYAVAAIIAALAGLYMIWTRGSVGDVVNHVAISIDAILILVFAALAVRYAIARDIRRHRRWAMRLFLVASAVWFFRISLMGWVVLTGGAGIEWETFTGPFVYFLNFAQYLVPLAVLQLYFRTQERPTPAGQLAMAGALIVLTAFMGIGIFAASAGMWLPKI